LLVGWEWAQKPSLYGLAVSWFARRGYTLDIIGKRAIYFTLSGILIVPGLVCLFAFGLKQGIEFKSGTSIQVSFEKPANLMAVIHAAEKYSPELEPEVKLSKQNGQTMAFIKTTPLTEEQEYAFRDDLDKDFRISTREARVTFEKPVMQSTLASVVAEHAKASRVDMVGGVTETESREAIVRIKQFTPEKWDTVKEAIGGKYAGASFTQPRPVLDVVATVLPTISKELTQNAFWAVVLASVGIILYLSFRFAIGGLATGFKYGCCAFFALVHDTAFVLGLFAILGKFAGWEINSLFVTAVLTVIGFSVHDTIVVFDRIRENLRHRQRGETYEQLANRSVLQTMSRSVNTSFTVVLVLGALLVLGGPLMKHFYVALLAGIIIGTYSSIFNATPLLIVWDNIGSKTKAPKRKAFEDKPIVSRPVVNEQPRTTPETDEVQAEERPVEESVEMKAAGKSGKSARIKRKKRRF
jgi:preprotein translocase SecF subunit